MSKVLKAILKALYLSNDEYKLYENAFHDYINNQYSKCLIKLIKNLLENKK